MSRELKKMEVEAIVEKFIKRGLMDGQGNFDLKADSPLVSTGLIDSAGLVLLLSLLEKKFDINFSVEELASAELDTLSSIVSFVNEKLNQHVS